MVNTNDAEFISILAVDDACSYGLDPQEAATLVHQTKVVSHHLTFAYHCEGKIRDMHRISHNSYIIIIKYSYQEGSEEPM